VVESIIQNLAEQTTQNSEPLTLEDIVKANDISDDPRNLSDKIPVVIGYMHWLFPEFFVLMSNESLKDFAKHLEGELGDGYSIDQTELLSKMRSIRNNLVRRDEETRRVWPGLEESEKEEIKKHDTTDYRDLTKFLRTQGYSHTLKSIETYYNIFCGALVGKEKYFPCNCPTPPEIQRKREEYAIRDTFCKGKK